jgi:spore germination protein KC
VKTKLLLVILFGLLMGGCWDRNEVNDLAIVTGAAVDKAENQQIKLTIQVFIPRAIGVGQGGGGGISAGGGELTLVRSSEGVNIADAMSKVQARLPRRIFWGHCKVYIFGEETAKEGIADHIDFLVRHPEPRNRAYLYVSKGKAAEMLALTSPLERSSSETLRELADLNIGMAVTLVDFRNMLRGESEAVAIPLIEEGKKLEGQEGQQKRNLLIGTSVLKRDKMIGSISLRATRGLLWLRDEMIRATVTVKPENVEGFVSVNPIRSKTTLIPKIEQGKWKMVVKIDTEGDLVENGTKLNLIKPEMLAIAEKAVRDDINTRIELSLRMLQKELKADIVGFAGAFHRHYPKEWEKVKDRWDEIFPQVEVKTQIKVAIRRPGMTSTPTGVPQ